MSPADTSKQTATTEDTRTPAVTYPAWHATVAGGVAGLGSRMITAPLDLIRIRRQLSTKVVVYPSERLWETWRNIVQQEGGITALYRGNLAAIYLWVGYAATQFTVYNQVQETLKSSSYSLPATATAFVSGATAGCCATATTYPFDVCRTAFVAHGAAASVSSSASYDTASTTTRRSTPMGYTERPITVQNRYFPLSHHHHHHHPSTHPAAPSSIDLFAESTSSSLRSFPRSGGASGSAGAATASALPFSSLYEPCHHTMMNSEAHAAVASTTTTTTTATSRASPAVSAAATATTTPPAPHRMTFRSFAVTLYQQKGFLGFYAGAFPALIQIVPYMGLNFAIYDWLTTRHHRATTSSHSSSSSSSVVSSAYAGSISGAVSKLVVYPLDTVKRRIQAQALLVHSSSSSMEGSEYNYRYRGMYDCLVTIYQQEGWTSFYRGMVPSVLKTTIATSLSFALYRWTRNVLDTIHNDGRHRSRASSLT